MNVIVRAWNKDGFHKDLAWLDERQVRMHQMGMEPSSWHIIAPLDASRVVVDPKAYPEITEFEVIVER